MEETTQRLVWTDGHASYPPAIKKLPEHVPHGTVNHSKWEFKNKRNQTTNAIENTWRQTRRWLNIEEWSEKIRTQTPSHRNVPIILHKSFQRWHCSHDRNAC